MKKLESLNSPLFENFKENEVSKLNKVIGGAPTATNVAAENCTYKDGPTTTTWENGTQTTSPTDRLDEGTPMKR